MKQIIGFALFCFAVGMLVMLIIENRFIGLIIIVGCMLAGYFLFGCRK